MQGGQQCRCVGCMCNCEMGPDDCVGGRNYCSPLYIDYQCVQQMVHIIINFIRMSEK